MPANKVSYLVLFTDDSQVYATNTKAIALSTPPPEGVPLEDKRILFVAYQPDKDVLAVYPLPQEEVLSAEIKYKKLPEPKVEDDDET